MSEQNNFHHAVTLAAAFIANGDIRLGSSRGDADAMQTLKDLLVTLTDVVRDARELQQLEHEPEE